MIPVHLPYKEQWFILVISILDCCILFLIPLTSVKTLNITLSYTHLKANSSVRNAGCYTLRKVSFFKWTRFLKCPKQTNKTDCDVFTCLGTISRSQPKSITLLIVSPTQWNGQWFTEPCNSQNWKIPDLPENLQWISGQNTNPNESARRKLDKEVTSAGLSYHQPPKIERHQLLISCNQQPT